MRNSKLVLYAGAIILGIIIASCIFPPPNLVPEKKAKLAQVM